MHRRIGRIGGLVAAILAGALVLTACTPSGYRGARATVAIQARWLGIPMSSGAVSCKPKPHDIVMHRCTAPLGANGSQVTIDVRVSHVTTPYEKVEAVVAYVPASLARGSLRRSEPGWRYVTQAGWRERTDGSWAVDPAVPVPTFLVDASGQPVEEI